MSNIKNLLPTKYHDTQRAISTGLVSKWEKTGLLEGLNSYSKPAMAVLLENQARQLVTEANQTGTSQNSEEWSGVALPLVRRVFSEIAAKDFVSVQPMNLPSGLVFYLDFKYSTAQAGFTTGAGKNSQADSVFGVTDADRGGVPGTGGLYGAGRFGYTINDVTASIAASAATPAANAYTSGSVTLATIGYDAEFSSSIWSVYTASMQTISIHTGSIAGYDPEGIRAFTLTDTGINKVFNQFTSQTGAVITFVVSGSAAGALTVHYHKQPTDVARGDFEDGKTQSGTGTLDIPEIDLQMRSEPIVAKTRKLKALWTPEFAQDLNAYHSIDAEQELTNMLSELISQEIDLEILDMLSTDAQTVDYWSAKLGYEWNGNGFSATVANASAYNQGTWFQTLGTKIQKVSNKIHQLTMRGGANFLVCSPTVATILESIPGYAADTDGDKAQFAMGVQKVGQINSRYQVYKNPYMIENTILMGYRGAQFLETGAVYAPYIPLMTTPLVYNQSTFTPAKGVMTRYAKKMVRPEYYGKIYVGHLNTL